MVWILLKTPEKEAFFMPVRYEFPRPPKKVKQLHPILAALLSGIFALAGLCAAVAVILLGIHCVDQKPILLSPPEAAMEQLTDMLEEYGDYLDVKVVNRHYGA